MNSPGSPVLTRWQNPVLGSRHGSSVTLSTTTRADRMLVKVPESRPRQPTAPLPNELRVTFQNPAAPSVEAYNSYMVCMYIPLTCGNERHGSIDDLHQCRIAP